MKTLARFTHLPQTLILCGRMDFWRGTGISNDCEGYTYSSPEDPFPDVRIGGSGGLIYNSGLLDRLHDDSNLNLQYLRWNAESIRQNGVSRYREPYIHPFSRRLLKRLTNEFRFRRLTLIEGMCYKVYLNMSNIYHGTRYSDSGLPV